MFSNVVEILESTRKRFSFWENVLFCAKIDEICWKVEYFDESYGGYHQHDQTALANVQNYTAELFLNMLTTFEYADQAARAEYKIKANESLNDVFYNRTELVRIENQ